MRQAKHTAMHRVVVGFLAALFTSLTFANAAGAAPRPAAQQVRITVSAAASLKDVLTELAQTFERQQQSTTVSLNFGASGALELQIEQGAPADIFFSASSEEMDKLDAKKLLRPNTRTDLLQNEIVLITPRDARIVSSFADLKNPAVRVIAVGDPRIVPAGIYAQQVLVSLGMYDAVKPKLVLATDVRQVLAYVETGSAEAGFVYGTDAAISQRVRVVADAPKGSHQPIVYPAAVLRDSQHADAAAAFLGFLRQPAARAAFTKAGFQPAAK